MMTKLTAPFLVKIEGFHLIII